MLDVACDQNLLALLYVHTGAHDEVGVPTQVVFVDAVAKRRIRCLNHVTPALLCRPPPGVVRPVACSWPRYHRVEPRCAPCPTGVSRAPPAAPVATAKVTATGPDWV
jgi:hypothetical protein